MKPRNTLVLIALALAAPLPAARGATVPVDGPSADVVTTQVVDVDMAPDGTGGVAYLKKVGGVNHVFVSRFVGGAFQSPVRVDTGLTDPSRRVFIAAANGGRLAVTFLNAPDLDPTGDSDIVFRPSASQPWTSPVTPFGANAYYAAVDLAPNGNGYLAIPNSGAPGGSVAAERITGNNVSLLATPLEQNSADEVTDEPFQRPVRVATFGTGGGAVVAFTEQDALMAYHVSVARLTGTSVGATQFAEVPSLHGASAVSSANDMVDVDMDGTGRAWVSFRENFNTPGNRGRAIVRPLVGNTLGGAQVLDALATPPPEAAEFPRVDVNPAGRGLSANARQLLFGIDAASLAGGTWSSLKLSTANNGAAAAPVSAIADSGTGLAAWKPGNTTKTVVGRIRTSSGFGGQTTLSNPAFGAETSSGLEAAAGGGSRALVAFIQGTAANARVVAAVVSLPPFSQAGGGTTPTNPAPRISKLKVKKRIRKTRARPRLTKKRKGSTISFSLSEAATVTLSFERKLAGRRVRGRCVKPKRSNRRARRCKRYKKVRTKIKLKAKKGTNRVRFNGRLSKRRSLKPGSYRMTAVARDSQGAKSKRKRASFRLLRAKRKRRG